jgi:hypothetical protein
VMSSSSTRDGRRRSCRWSPRRGRRCPGSASAASSSIGISRLHGMHQLAKRFTRTGRSSSTSRRIQAAVAGQSASASTASRGGRRGGPDVEHVQPLVPRLLGRTLGRCGAEVDDLVAGVGRHDRDRRDGQDGQDRQHGDDHASTHGGSTVGGGRDTAGPAGWPDGTALTALTSTWTRWSSSHVPPTRCQAGEAGRSPALTRNRRSSANRVDDEPEHLQTTSGSTRHPSRNAGRSPDARPSLRPPNAPARRRASRGRSLRNRSRVRSREAQPWSAGPDARRARFSPSPPPWRSPRPPPPPHPPPRPIPRGRSWLARHQLVDGERIEVTFDFGEGPQTFADQGLTADVVFALAAPASAARIEDATDWLESQVGAYTGTAWDDVYVGSVAKLLLVAAVTDRPPPTSAADLVALLEDREQATGRYTDADRVGGLQQRDHPVARRPRAAPHARRGPAVGGVDYLAGQACDDGGFPGQLDPETCTGDVDTTAFAVQALLPSPTPTRDRRHRRDRGRLAGGRPGRRRQLRRHRGARERELDRPRRGALRAAGASDATDAARGFLLALQDDCAARNRARSATTPPTRVTRSAPRRRRSSGSSPSGSPT